LTSILVTGGCGFIGSHQAVSLLEAGHEVVLVDDLSNADEGVIDRIATLAGQRPAFHRLDVRDTDRLAWVLAEHGCSAIVHFAGRKHVAESVEQPLGYFDVNLTGLLSLLKAADDTGVRKLLFSSSGSVYGDAKVFPIPEATEPAPTNPYSLSKAICERILASLCSVDPRWSVMALRYFNPAGAHPSGAIGEDSSLVSNIVPVVMEVAAGDRPSLTIHGVDHPTPDGTALRDFIHVMDVAEAHRRALTLLDDGPGFEVLNIGRGVGVSVREVIAATERVTGRRLVTVEGPPRPGDVAALYGDTGKAERRLGPINYRALDDICRDAWRFKLGRCLV
jgi:UDP-glucose 4-epimerase